MPEIITTRIRSTFRDAASGVVLRDIDRMWQGEGFAPGEITEIRDGQRVTRWKEYELSVDWTNRAHAARVIRVYETFLSEWGDDIERFTRVLTLDGWAIDEHRRIAPTSSRLSSLSGLDTLRDAGGILDAFQRIDLLLDSDPAGVVGAVKELIESTAKTVLDDLEIAYASDESVPGLISKTQTALGLAAAGVDGNLDTSAAVRRVLGGLSSIANGITELRNAEGGGHGRSRGTNLTARHARLAVNVGRAWCEIVLDTFGDSAAPWRTQTTNR
jgi:hypothetical protein